jgi:hypothetical protein
MHTDQNPIDDLFRNKLGNQETPPPSGVWEEVRAQVQLDQVFYQKLYTHEKAVPKRVWKSIRASLHPGSDSFTFIPYYFQYAAAAVLVLAIGLWWLYPTNDASGIKLGNLKPLSLAFQAQMESSQDPRSEKVTRENAGNLWFSARNNAQTDVPTEGSVNYSSSPKQFISTEIQREFSSNSTGNEPTEKFDSPSDASKNPTLNNLILDSKLITQDFKSEVIPSTTQPYLSSTTNSRNNNNTTLPWTVSSLFSPDVNFASARNLGNEISNQQGKIQYTAGVRLGYSLNERWTIQSGVQYADQGTMQIPRGEQDNYTGTSSFSRLGPPMEVKAQIIDVPVVVRYRILGDKLRWYVNSGFNANLTGGASSVLVGTGTEFRANPKISISIEPTLRRTIETMPNLKPNTLGIFTGINYKFQ